ncbi:hypothetical protein QYF36_026095 [Acer negundo]|nr:hypothetical protein QYF36_026095 [Acer negundo]
MLALDSVIHSLGPYLNQIYDEHKDDSVWYHANELLPLKDEHVHAKVMSCLSKCIEEFDTATVTDKQIRRFPKF